jgi:tripeptide aminopeptidase
MDLKTIASLPLVIGARARAAELQEEVLDEQLELVAIPAPSYQEAERAAFVERRFQQLGLVDVHLDGVGNVFGRLPGSEHGSESGAALVTAHLDTVFAAETPLTPRRAGSRIHAPGITDNCRGLAAMLGTARVMIETGLSTRRQCWFVATVGEEGSGDLYGVKHIFREGGDFGDAAAFISLDGSGLRRIVHRALGSKRLRVEIRGPGGHSWADFGAANPLHAAAAVIAAARDVPLSTEPAASLTVARAGGGSSINAIPAEAWFEVDMRSEGSSQLRELESAFRDAVARALDDENRRRRSGTPPLQLVVEVIGDRPSGSTPADDPLVTAAMEATRLVGAEPELVASSTDSNVPISLGIPAITIGAGGESGGIHTLDEWYDDRHGGRGVERSLLVALAAAGGCQPARPARTTESSPTST